MHPLFGQADGKNVRLPLVDGSGQLNQGDVVLASPHAELGMQDGARRPRVNEALVDPRQVDAAHF